MTLYPTFPLVRWLDVLPTSSESLRLTPSRWPGHLSEWHHMPGQRRPVSNRATMLPHWFHRFRIPGPIVWLGMSMLLLVQKNPVLSPKHDLQWNQAQRHAQLASAKPLCTRRLPSTSLQYFHVFPGVEIQNGSKRRLQTKSNNWHQLTGLSHLMKARQMP